MILFFPSCLPLPGARLEYQGIFEAADNYVELTWLMFQKMIIIYPGLKIFGPFDIQTNQPVRPVK